MMDDLDLLEALWATPTPTDTAAAETRHEAPPLTGLQRQGDLLLIPFDALDADAHAHLNTVPLLVPVCLDPDHPLTVLDGDHAHQVRGRGATSWAPAVGTPTQTRGALGVLVVPPCGNAWLEHTGHHAPLAVGPGRYLLRRQRAFVPSPVAPAPTRDRGRRPAHKARPIARPQTGQAPTWRTVWD